MVKNKKKVKFFRKKVMFNLIDREIGAIWENIRELYKRVNNEKGDIPATLSLKDIGNGIWELEIKGVDNDQYCNIKGDLSMIFHMGYVFKRIYNLDKKEEKEV